VCVCVCEYVYEKCVISVCEYVYEKCVISVCVCVSVCVVSVCVTTKTVLFAFTAVHPLPKDDNVIEEITKLRIRLRKFQVHKYVVAESVIDVHDALCVCVYMRERERET